MKDKENALLHIKMGLVFIILITPLILASCATHIATRATQVRLVTALRAQDVENICEFLGNVTGSDFPYVGCFSWLDVWQRIAYNNALNELMKNAAELGATHLFVNLGYYYDLRGEAFVCAYCLGPKGEPDVAYCLGESGKPDVAYCQDFEGKPVGKAYCDGADKDNEIECIECDGKWIPAIDHEACEAQEHEWIGRARSIEVCEFRGGTWLPVAKDQVTCEEAKGGKWILNEDVLRRLEEEEGGD